MQAWWWLNSSKNVLSRIQGFYHERPWLIRRRFPNGTATQSAPSVCLPVSPVPQHSCTSPSLRTFTFEPPHDKVPCARPTVRLLVRRRRARRFSTITSAAGGPPAAAP